ncbi:MAG: hypothetical protein AB1805_10760 [Nitrospirota bacterium]
MSKKRPHRVIMMPGLLIFFLLYMTVSLAAADPFPTAPVTFSDDFSTNTISHYTIVNTWTEGGTGSVLHDLTNQRMRVLTGDNIGLQFSHPVPTVDSGIFTMDFLPAEKFPLGGRIYIRLIQDEHTFYELYNSDGYAPGWISKRVNGQEVDKALFTNGYIQNMNYTVMITFSPESTIVEAFGQVLTLQGDTSSIMVGSFSVEVSQQNAYFDTISMVSDAPPPPSPSPVGTLVINGDAASTDSTSVDLTLSCSGTNGCLRMRFSNDAVFWSTPEAYDDSRTWILLPGDGTKTVYAMFQDGMGNWSSAPSHDTIVLNTGYELGTKEMVTGAGAATVPKPARTYTKQITAPGVLNQSNTEYVLMNDVVANGTAFTIQGSNITLNLNGKKVTYLNANASTAYGVHIDGYSRSNVAILNGTIQQGAGSCSGNQNGYGCNPLYAYETFFIEVGGLDITWRAADTGGIYLHWGGSIGGAHVHHNTLNDQGTVVTNRHQGVAAIRAGTIIGSRIHHNLIKRTRHIGIGLGNSSEAYNNEITIDSCATNSFGVVCGPVSNFVVYHNKIAGMGEHPIGIACLGDQSVTPPAACSNGTIYSNYTETQNTKTSAEYGNAGSAGFRTTWGADNIEVMYNTFVVKAGNYNNTGFISWGRALWVGLPVSTQKAEFHDNVIVANNNDGVGKAAGIAVVCLNESPNLIFRNNTVTSNWANALLSDSYGYSKGYPLFIDNILVKQDSCGSYRTIKSDYLYYVSTGAFISNDMQGGASMDSINLQFSSTEKKEIKAGWHLTVFVKDGGGAPAAGATVTVRDVDSAVVFTGTADGSGKVSTTPGTIQYFHTNVENGVVVSREIKDIKTPHTVTAASGGLSGSATVSLDGDKTVTVTIQ